MKDVEKILHLVAYMKAAIVFQVLRFREQRWMQYWHVLYIRIFLLLSFYLYLLK